MIKSKLIHSRVLRAIVMAMNAEKDGSRQSIEKLKALSTILGMTVIRDIDSAVSAAVEMGLIIEEQRAELARAMKDRFIDGMEASWTEFPMPANDNAPPKQKRVRGRERAQATHMRH